MPAPAPPEVVDAALLAVADGASHQEAGRIAGVGQPTVSKWVRRLQERLEGLTTRLRYRATRKVLGAFDGMADARIIDASNPESRTGPMSFKALMDVSVPRGPESLTIHADVDIVNVSADVRMVIARSTDPAELRRRAEEITARLGF